jgi:voltage-gated potassium channel
LKPTKITLKHERTLKYTNLIKKQLMINIARFWKNFLRKIKFYSGLKGVDGSENERALKIGKQFEYPMLFAAVWIPVQAYIESTSDIAIPPVFEWTIWSLFLLETVVITGVVNNKVRYLKQNWLNLFIIIFGFPMFWSQTPIPSMLRMLRLIFLIALFVRLFRIVHSVFMQNHLGLTLFFGLLFVFISGAALYRIDPAITSLSDGFWWALVTVTTVGYGDISPTSDLGRIFASLLIILGVVLFSLITANISAFLVSKNKKEQDKGLIDKLDNIQNKLDKIEKELTTTRIQNDRYK